MQVRQSPCIRPSSTSIFIKGTVPPMRTSSAMTYLPLGLRSASTGVRLPMRVKSSSESLTRAVCAMASRCSTALVEPPRAVTRAMAFSKASLVRISLGRMPRLIRPSTARPAERQSTRLAAEMAAWAELLGRLMPMASMADAMVLAVYIPPQEPAPGMAHSSICRSSRASMSPRAWAPTASNTETISTSWPLCLPGMMVPP